MNPPMNKQLCITISNLLCINFRSENTGNTICVLFMTWAANFKVKTNVVSFDQLNGECNTMEETFCHTAGRDQTTAPKLQEIVNNVKIVEFRDNQYE